ncbi:MAG: 3'-5' exoribonuclease [Clostridiales bacterium]|nr:3'-5' exoribonuclease [Clostridiales bacterium]
MNEFISQLKESIELDFEGVKLSEINAYIKQNTLEIIFVCPDGKEKSLNDNIKVIAEKTAEILKTSFKIKIKIKKSYFDEAYFTYSLLGFVEKYPMIKHNLKSGNFAFEYNDSGIKVILSVPSAVAEYINGRKIKSELENFVNNNYCENIEIAISPVEIDDEEIEFEPPENKLVYDYEGGRKIKVSNVEPFIGDVIYERPSYIVDARPGDGVILCGKIKEFTERKRTMKEGETEQKYFFKFRLEDFTGSIDCIYFPTKKSLEKIRLLSDGKEIVAFGTTEMNTFKGVTTLSYRVRYISLCTLPTDFVVNRARMVLPEEYRCVHPVPYESYEQDNIFKVKEDVPDYLLGKEFVVYDFETTGLNQSTDKIIEIGAVKIKDGVITECFSTLVDPECLIPEKATAVNHITDADVKGAPLIGDVMPDFFKFCFGAIMVGQNSLQFDWPLLRAKAEPMNIYFENDQLDILLLAKKYYPDLSKYNLDFLSKKFGIVNEAAHRALSDTITTAKVFIKLAAHM